MEEGEEELMMGSKVWKRKKREGGKKFQVFCLIPQVPEYGRGQGASLPVSPPLLSNTGDSLNWREGEEG